MRRLLLPAALVVACLAVFAGASSAKVISKCVPNVRPGIQVVNKLTIRVFCGTAKATVHAGGITYKRSNGACYLEAVSSLVIGLGKYTGTGIKPLYPALFMAIGAPKDGTYHSGTLTLQRKGKILTSNNLTVVVSGKRTHGTFSGKFEKGPSFTGSFTCK
jgi:glutamine amidotransferase-like uncharacterized protein